MKSSPNIMDSWLQSGQPARICGLDFCPRPQSLMPGRALAVTKGQATVFVLRQQPHGRIWFLKRFARARRPDTRYLLETDQCVPGYPEFISCTQRRLLEAAHLDHRASRFWDDELREFLKGCILMPKVPGESWLVQADELRAGHRSMPLSVRLKAAIHLARAVLRLEAGECSHRDLSGGNVFIEPDGNVHLIDWDSVFHHRLAFQANTTIGTAGYIAPFVGFNADKCDARRSWRTKADRFAMSILMVELLIVAHTTPAQEDGTLFSQAQLDQPESPEVYAQVHRLERLSVPLAWHFLAALQAKTFEACPSPQQWVAILNRELALRGANHATATVSKPQVGKGARLRLKRCRRDQSSRTIHLDRARHQERTRPYPHEQRAAATGIRLFCEHCQVLLTKPRTHANELRERGRPLLCRPCLENQKCVWEDERRERDRVYPGCICSRCPAAFRIPRDKLDLLLTRGREILCRNCLKAMLEGWQSSRGRSHIQAGARIEP